MTFIPGKDAYYCENCGGFGDNSRRCDGCGEQIAIIPSQVITQAQTQTSGGYTWQPK